MIRLFLKTLMISLISIVLSFGEVVAYAESNGTITQAKDGSGALQKERTFDFKKATTMDSSALVTMALIALVAMQLIKYPKWTWDVKVAAGAGAAYIIGEILNVMNTKSELNKLSASVTIRTDGKEDSAQVEYIKGLKESYQKVLGGLVKKKSLLKMAFAGFTIALGIAVYSRVKQDTKYLECMNDIRATITALNECIANPVSAAASTVCVADLKPIAEMPGVLTLLQNSSILVEPTLTKAVTTNTEAAVVEADIVEALASPNVEPSSKALKIKTASSCGKESGFLELLKQYQTTGKPGDIKASSHSPSPSMIQGILRNALDLLIPTANAGFSSILLMVIGGSAILLKPVATAIDTVLASPGLRSITWGFFLAMTTFSMNITDKKIGDVNDNIKKIDGILSEMDRLKRGVNVKQGSISTVKTITSIDPDQDVQVSTNPNDKTPCIADNTATSTNGCTSAVATDAKFASIGGLPEGLVTMNSQFSGLLDSISNKSTIKGSSFSQMNSLSNKANAILPRILADRKNIFDKLKETGATKLSVEQMEEKFKKDLGSSIDKTLKEKGMGTNNLMASISGLKAPEKVELPKDGKLASPKINNAAVGSNQQKNNNLNLKFDDASAGSLAELTLDSSGQDNKVEKFDMKGTEISKDGESIFSLISKRYFKSGYPVLLEEIPSSK